MRKVIVRELQTSLVLCVMMEESVVPKEVFVCISIGAPNILGAIRQKAHCSLRFFSELRAYFQKKFKVALMPPFPYLLHLCLYKNNQTHLGFIDKANLYHTLSERRIYYLYKNCSFWHNFQASILHFVGIDFSLTKCGIVCLGQCKLTLKASNSK